MLWRLLVSFLLVIPLYGAGDSWYSKINTQVEFGIYQPLITGSITNLVASSTLEKSFAYHETKASFFALHVKHQFDYIPNVDFSYFNLQDARSSKLLKPAKVADATFSSNVASAIDYKILSLVLYQDFKLRGKKVFFLGRKIYSGDLEFDIGLNAQLFQWQFNVQNLDNLAQVPSWISVNIFVPLPYIGLKYYWYNYTLHMSIADLAFGRAKSAVYKTTLDYKLLKGLYISGGYLYEQFKVLEGTDSVNFTTSGLKFSFKYAF